MKTFRILNQFQLNFIHGKESQGLYMDILQLETEASKLRIYLLKNKLQRHKLFLIHSFFKTLLEESSKNIIESYLLEFIDNYTRYLSALDISGLNPVLIELIIKQAEIIDSNYLDEKTNLNLKTSILYLKAKYFSLIDILNGKEMTHPNKDISFPLLEIEPDKIDVDYGMLGTISVQLKPNLSDNRFHIIPGNEEPDEMLKDQVENALNNAIKIASKYTKLKHNYWEIYIDFGLKSACYSGNSFGVLLVLKLVEEILRYYDSPTKILSNTSAAFTGSVDKNGYTKTLSKDIITQKIKIIFYSGTKIFVLPDDDLFEAKNTLQSLNAIYPNRNLRLIGIQTIDDLFNLRNVVEIKKESPILRTGKFIKKRSVSFTLLILLAVVLFLSGLWDFDNNPVMYDINNRTIKIENKNGKELWSFECIENTMAGLNGAVPNIALKFYDIDNDGINEVLLCREKLTTRDPNYGRIICYNNKKEKQWQYIFRDTVFTPEYRHTNFFTSNIIDIVDEKNKQILYAFADNDPLYPSAIYKLNVKNGQRIDSSNVLWNSGGIFSAIIGNSNYATKREVVAIALNNGYERSVLFAINTDKLNGRSPAPPYYTILNQKLAEFDQYILLPKSDLTNLYFRWNSPKLGSLFFDRKTSEFNFIIGEYDSTDMQHALIYRCGTEMNDFYIDCADDFQKTRDTLVARGKLKPPYTYTPEYFRGLKEQIRYWNGEKFVTATERFR